MSESSQASSPSSFFNLHVEGVGYLNRVRTVKPKKGQEFLACTVSALRGSDADVSYTKFDCRVSGADAQSVVKRLEADVAAGKRGVTVVDNRIVLRSGRDETRLCRLIDAPYIGKAKQEPVPAGTVVESAAGR